MTRKTIIFFLLFTLSMQGLKAYSQVKISGPECILPGTEYQYDFYGKWDKQSEIKICVEGGVIVANNNTCYTISGTNYVRVIWNENITKGKVSITTPSNVASMDVKATQLLQPGNIDSSLKKSVRFSAAMKTITCTSARGGSCDPSYTYQWEQSDDNLHWTAIKGATFQHLTVPDKLNKTIFFRRKIVEMKSNSIAHSDVAMIVVTNSAETN